MKEDHKKAPACDHHLILGRTTDILTGEDLPDTHDERLRQGIARFLLEEKSYHAADITPRLPLVARSGTRTATVLLDFAVSLDGKIGMIVRYGPGSLVTRERPALAMSRLAAPFQIPVAVVTNGLDAEVLDGSTGRVSGQGKNAIPDRNALANIMAHADFKAISPKKAEMEGRILYTFEAVGTCNCEDG